jgi:hypothetical protein
MIGYIRYKLAVFLGIEQLKEEIYDVIPKLNKKIINNTKEIENIKRNQR